MIDITVFQVVMPSNDMIGYRCFGEPCCLHLQGGVNGYGQGDTKIGRKYTRR
jgi:hypothetical protein